MRRLLRVLTLAGLVALAACSNAATTSGNPGTGGVTGAGSGGVGAGGAGTGGSGTGGLNGTGGRVGAGGGSGGNIGPATGGSGTAGAGVGAAGTPGTGGRGGGGTSVGGSTGAGGATNCAGRAISLGANGTAMDSDAARARVVVDLMTDLPIGNAPRTIEFWAFIKPTDWMGERNEIFEYGTAGTTTTAFGLDFGTNPVLGMPTNHATLNPYTNGAFTTDSTAYLGITSTTNQWVHIAMTWDGIALLTYVNGVLGITTNGANGATMLATAQTPLTIGCNDPIFNCFNGYFDEFRVWRVARTAAQISGSYNKVVAGNDPDLVGYWKFDDAPGSTTAADAVTAPNTPHAGVLMATTAALPTFITPTPPVPLVCP